MGKRNERILKGSYILFRANGTEQAVAPANGKKFELSELKRLVGGTATIMHLGANPRMCITAVDGEGEAQFTKVNPWLGHMVRKGWVLVVNENGLNEGLPMNDEALAMWGGLVVGDVVLCRFDATPWHGVRGFRVLVPVTL
jgi:hypothetical protein